LKSTSICCVNAACAICFPTSARCHLEHTVGLVASGRVRLKPAIKHILHGIEQVPQAFEITANKGRYQALNPAQVMMA